MTSLTLQNLTNFVGLSHMLGCYLLRRLATIPHVYKQLTTSRRRYKNKPKINSLFVSTFLTAKIGQNTHISSASCSKYVQCGFLKIKKRSLSSPFEENSIELNATLKFLFSSHAFNLLWSFSLYTNIIETSKGKMSKRKGMVQLQNRSPPQEEMFGSKCYIQLPQRPIGQKDFLPSSLFASLIVLPHQFQGFSQKEFSRKFQ